MTTSTLLKRLTSEADAYAEGSYLHDLCTDAAEHIKAQQKIIEGGDVGRKVMTADVDNSKRLANDHADALSRSLDELANLQKEAIDSVEYTSELEADNAKLRAMLKAYDE